MPLYSALFRLLSAVLRSFRALLWSALVATAHAQLVPPSTRRSETAWPEVKTPASPEAEITATVPRPAPSPSTPLRLPAPASRFTTELFKYLERPEPETLSLRDDNEPYSGIVISDAQVLKIDSNFHAILGTGAGQLRWAGSGGFAAYGSDRTVQLHGDTTPLIWGQTTHFIGASDVLVFGASDSDATLIWDKRIDLGGGLRTIRIIEGLQGNQRASVRFNQGLLNGDLIFEGGEALDWNSPHGGRADLSAANNDWRGNLTVRGADVHANLHATLRKLDSISIERGGRFAIDNLGTHSSLKGGLYLENRLSQFTTINLNSGTLSYWGRDWGHSFERTGFIDLLGGANVIDIVNHRPGQSTVLTIGGMYRNPGSTLNLTNSRTTGGSFGTGGNTPQLKFRDQAGPWAIPALEGGILPWATVNGTDFATLKGKHLVAYTDYNLSGEGTWTWASNGALVNNASPLTDQHLTTHRTVNSLRLANGRTITLAPNTALTLNAGALLSTGQASNKIEGGALVTAEREFFAHVFHGSLSISSDIRHSSASNAEGISLVKTGDGTLILSGKNLSALRGNHHINQGTLILNRSGEGLGLSGHITVGDGGLHDANLVLYGNAQLQRSTRLTLRGSARLTRDPSDPNGETWKRGHSNLIIYDSTQYLDTLTIEGTGVIHFAESGNDRADILGFDHILMADATSELLIRGWQAFNDHLLIRRDAGAEIAQHLGQIKFEGYDSAAKLIDYNHDYLEIVPTGFNGVPEPSTTGAILGAGALGFFAWRKRRSRNN